MLPIYICEDNTHELKIIEDAVRLFFEIKYPEITAHIYSFSNPHQLLSEITEHSEQGIYLLDYDLKCDMNGLELSQKIRNHDSIGPITFISTYEECWRLSHRYRVYAMNFISKDSPYQQRQISDALDASINYFNTIKNQALHIDNPLISIKSGRNIYQLEKEKIIYIISSEKEHIIDVYTKRLVVHPRDTITNFMDKLYSDSFFQCNRTSVINLNYIDKIDADKLIVTVVKKDFPLSKAKLKELKSLISKSDRGH